MVTAHAGSAGTLTPEVRMGFAQANGAATLTLTPEPALPPPPAQPAASPPIFGAAAVGASASMQAANAACVLFGPLNPSN